MSVDDAATRLDAAVRRELELARIELAVPEGGDVRETLTRIVAVVTELLPADGGASLVLFDRETESFHTSVSTIAGQPADTTAERVRSRGASRWIVDNLTPHVVEDVADDRFGANAMLVEHDLHSYVGVPLAARGEPIGVLYAMSHRPRRYSADDLRFLRLVADRAAVVIQNERARERAASALVRAEALYEVSAALTDCDDDADLREVLLQGLERILDADAVLLVPCPGGGFADLTPVVRGTVAADVDHRRLTELAAEELEPLLEVRGVVTADDDGPAGLLASLLGADRLLVTPMTTHDVHHAIVAVRAPAAALDDATARFVSMLADQAATTLENLSLLHELVRRAGTDPLTGVGNRRRFMEAAEREVARAQRLQRPYAVLMLDLDHFKRVNDQHGHSVGDEVLQAVAARLNASMREIDLLARYGGEEFIVFLTDTDAARAEEVGQRLRAHIRDAPIVTAVGALPVRISVGAAVVRPGEPLDDVINRADAALYAAKEAGRDRVVVRA